MGHSENIELAKESAVNAYVDGKINAVQTELDAMTSSRATALASLSSAEQLVGTLRTQNTALTSESTTLKSQASALNAEIVELNKTIVALNTRIRELEATPSPEPITDGVRISELNLTNPRSLREAFTKNGNGKRLILEPNTIYEDRDFIDTNGKAVWNMPGSFAGIEGGGPTTVLRITPGSSTRAGSVPTGPDGTTNPYHTFKSTAATRPLVFRKFSLEGNAGHLHGGMQIRTENHPLLMEDIRFIDSGPGDHWSPPGETFMGVSLWHCYNDNWLKRIYGDGAGRSSSIIGWNDSKNCFMDDVTLENAPHGMLTWWECENIETWNVKSLGGHHGMNHERNTGYIRHHNPTATVNRTASPNGMHFTFNNDLGNASPIEIHDPIVDNGLRSGSVMVMTGRNYRGVVNKQTTVPEIYKQGVKLTMVDYGATGTKPAVDANKYWWMYR